MILAVYVSLVLAVRVWCLIAMVCLFGCFVLLVCCVRCYYFDCVELALLFFALRLGVLRVLGFELRFDWLCCVVVCLFV